MPRLEDPGLDRDDEEDDARDEEGGQGVVGHRDAADDGCAKEPAIGSPPLPAEEEGEEERRQRDVEPVRVGMGGQPPGERERAEDKAGGEGEQRASRQLTDEDHGERRRACRQERRQQVHPERRLAERREDDRGEPAEDDVGRVAGRVGGAQDRADGLELTGVPEGDARQEGRPGEPERDDGRDRRCQPNHGRSRAGEP